MKYALVLVGIVVTAPLFGFGIAAWHHGQSGTVVSFFDCSFNMPQDWRGYGPFAVPDNYRWNRHSDGTCYAADDPELMKTATILYRAWGKGI